MTDISVSADASVAAARNVPDARAFVTSEPFASDGRGIRLWAGDSGSSEGVMTDHYIVVRYIGNLYSSRVAAQLDVVNGYLVCACLVWWQPGEPN